MKLALTGASSTGKTTLARSLIASAEFTSIVPELVGVDARSILVALGIHNVDEMSPRLYGKFQFRYMRQKFECEARWERFLTERSFVDVFAYWLTKCADGYTASTTNRVECLCAHMTEAYDMHFYLPFGVIPFRADGWRSRDLVHHSLFDSTVVDILRRWNVRFMTLSEAALQARTELVIRSVQNIKHD